MPWNFKPGEGPAPADHPFKAKPPAPVDGEWGFDPSKPSLADVIACDVCERMRTVTETDPVERHVFLHGAVQEAVAAALRARLATPNGSEGDK